MDRRRSDGRALWPSRGWQLAVTGACIVAASMLTTCCSVVVEVVPRTSRALVAGAMALGPAFGWWEAASRGDLPRACGFLVGATVPSVGLVLLWLLRPHVELLAVGGLLWFLAGYYFAVGMWI